MLSGWPLRNKMLLRGKHWPGVITLWQSDIDRDSKASFVMHVRHQLLSFRTANK